MDRYFNLVVGGACIKAQTVKATHEFSVQTYAVIRVKV